MKKILLFIIMQCLFSCNDWLNVKPNMEIDKYAMYSTESGFKSALAGCYIKLKSEDLYGKALTMTTIEYLAQHWEYSPNTLEDHLSNYRYEESTVDRAFTRIYEKLYNVIVQANEIIYYAKENKHVFYDDRTQMIILGEALAIRAFCHLDILRLWGPVPSSVNKQETLALSYITTVTKDKIDSDTWDSYVRKMETDFQNASDILKQIDPVMKYTYEVISDPGQFFDDSYYMYRQFRFNYYGVEALKARFYLYTQNKEKAREAALNVINAKNGVSAKDPFILLSGYDDITSDKYVSPKEHLVSLSIFNINDYAENLFKGTRAINKSKELVDRDLFDYSINDVRLINLWTTITNSGTGLSINVLKKYWQDAESADKLVSLTEQMVPIIRLSEVYLIAIESSSIVNANILANDYFMKKHIVYEPFSDENQVIETVIKEYNKEFYGEGQLFYAYKRLNVGNIMWHEYAMTKDKYVIPMPLSEKIK